LQTLTTLGGWIYSTKRAIDVTVNYTVEMERLEGKNIQRIDTVATTNEGPLQNPTKIPNSNKLELQLIDWDLPYSDKMEPVEDG
jgi:hypothetical protein